VADDRYFGDLKRVRETWKQERLHGGYLPEEVNYQRLREEWQRPKPEPEPPTISLETRFQGMYFCARPGTGKTQLIQDFLLQDLDMVARDEASIVVLDPTGNVGGNRPSLIHVLTRLKRFARGGDLFGRLVYIDPLVPDYTVPINLLSLRLGASSAEALRSAIDSYISLMGGLMGQPLTNHQDPVFRYAIQVAMVDDHPTLQTLQNIIGIPAPGEAPYYEKLFDRLDPVVQGYFRRSYETRRAPPGNS
jgi:hypothetical protein